MSDIDSIMKAKYEAAHRDEVIRKMWHLCDEVLEFARKHAGRDAREVDALEARFKALPSPYPPAVEG